MHRQVEAERSLRCFRELRPLFLPWRRLLLSREPCLRWAGIIMSQSARDDVLPDVQHCHALSFFPLVPKRDIASRNALLSIRFQAQCGMGGSRVCFGHESTSTEPEEG